MKDDIETLRRLADGLGTGERKEAMAALESVENVLGQKFIDNEIERMQRYGADTLAGIMARATVAETERDSLRASAAASAMPSAWQAIPMLCGL